MKTPDWQISFMDQLTHCLVDCKIIFLNKNASKHLKCLLTLSFDQLSSYECLIFSKYPTNHWQWFQSLCDEILLLYDRLRKRPEMYLFDNFSAMVHHKGSQFHNSGKNIENFKREHNYHLYELNNTYRNTSTLIFYFHLHKLL